MKSSLPPFSTLLLKTLFNTEYSVPNLCLQHLERALRLFNNTDSGESLRTCNMVFAQDANFTNRERVIRFLVSTMLRQIQSKSPNVYTTSQKGVVVVDTEQNTFHLHPNLVRLIQNWYYHSHHPTAVFQIDAVEHGVSHRTVLLLDKNPGRLAMAWLDSLHSETRAFQMRNALQALFPGRVVVDKRVRSVAKHCSPMLNLCLMLCYTRNPGLLEQPWKLDRFFQHVDRNMQLFELYMFFISLAVVPQYVQMLLSTCAIRASSLRINMLLREARALRACGLLPPTITSTTTTGLSRSVFLL